jgi:hypothetical protein
MKRKVIFLALVLLGLFARLYLAHHFYGNYDQHSYEIVADIMQRGGNVYAETYRYNYSPAWSFVLLGLKYLSDFTHFSFHFVVRSFLTGIDLLCAITISLIARRWSAGLIYWLNPVAVLLVGYHGQFDNFAALLLLTAMYLQKKKVAPGFLWLLGTASILIKHILLFSVFLLFLYVFRKKWQAVLAMSASVLVFGLSFIPYLPDGLYNTIHRVFLYTAMSRIYGLSNLFPFWTAPVFIVVMILMMFFIQRQFSLIKGMEISWVSFFTFTSGIAQQYFILPTLFGSISPSKGLIVYSVACTVFLLFSGNSFHIGVYPLWNLVWFAAAGWFLSCFTELRKLAPAAEYSEIEPIT